MSQSVGRLSSLILPGILAIFLALYLTALVSGAEPESALARAGLAGVVLAVLGRLALRILEAAPPPKSSPRGHRLDVEIGDGAEAPSDTVATPATHRPDHIEE